MKSDFIPIPVLGAPLAGKYTIVEILSSLYSSELCFTDTMIDEGPFAGPITTAYVDIGENELIYRVLAMPGGVPTEAYLNFLPGAERCVFVFDPLRREQEIQLWRLVADRIPREGWFFVINKLDLVDRGFVEVQGLDTEEGAKEYLRDRGAFDDRPFISISAIDDSARSHVKGLFREIIS